MKEQARANTERATSWNVKLADRTPQHTRLYLTCRSRAAEHEAILVTAGTPTTGILAVRYSGRSAKLGILPCRIGSIARPQTRHATSY